ncbi:MAG: hypothetical protein IT285_00995 [Bdellovibrionales bacterium]|nr:hypothetical protein [Bdellovibrionales bacterium]
MIQSQRIRAVKRFAGGRALLVPLFALFLCGAGPVDDELPTIEAKPFATFARRRSQSLRVYVLDAKEYMPRVGKMVLLKREAQNMMAFRVLKTYPDKGEFAARKVREYESRASLPLGEAYLGLEKLRDIGGPPPTEAELRQDDADLKELEAPQALEGLPAVQGYDDDLDAGTSPPPAGAVDDDGEGDEPEQDDSDLENIAADEVLPLDPDNQWLTAQFGTFKNSAAIGGTDAFAGGGMRYGLTLGKMLFLASKSAQDALVLEGGVFFYKILGENNEAFTVLPVTITGRYQILMSADFAVFFYFGINNNIVASVAGGTEQQVALLSSTLPAGGGGMMFRIGPKWHLRGDLGIDMIGGGLVLRF